MLNGEYEPEKVERRWQEEWVRNNTFAYDGERAEKNGVFSIDTPPPTVSGDLHMGHLYGATLQDFVARFRRMRGDEVFFPFGYDDNGIASERLTERELGIRHQDFTRREFQEKCREVCEGYEEDFTEKMQALALSMDWGNTYKTIEPRVQKISQLSFIDLYEKDREYRKEGPTIWCPECQTAISQVEMEDAERHSHFNDIKFPLVGEENHVVISTTRPELLPACVAIFVHPEDERGEELLGKKARVPLFGQEVPILEDERVDMETGSGIVMCCTFGDQTDIEWYRAHKLPERIAIDESGTMTGVAGDYEGMSTEDAREAIAEELEEEGYLLDREDITHTVKVHERCDHDIEFRMTTQWYIKLLDRKEDYLKAGQKMEWYPEKMFTRYRHWIEGLQWDWIISRQRDSGIPFPVWYCEECDREVLARKENLPVDPMEDEPSVEECPGCGGSEFVPEEDVLDTWATSSLTPLINAHWGWDPGEEEFEIERPELYPMDLRPQGHDIISFWLFHTVVKCLEHTGEVPFRSVMINGMVLDKNREKMSKSKGNVVLPDEVLEKFPVDAARYWAAGTSIGDDFPYKEKDLVTGQKLMTKLWNASRLVEELSPEEVEEVEELEDIDRWMLAKLDEEIEFITESLEDYGFSRARNRLREFFWHTFCDNYLEIAKQRLKEGESESAEYVLREAHRKFLKLFAPFLCHITEEVWRSMYGEGTIHTEGWPAPSGAEADIERGENSMEIIHGLRKYKTDNQLSMNHEIRNVKVFGGDIEGFEDAVKEVMHVGGLERITDRQGLETRVAGVKLNYDIVGPKYGERVSEIEGAIEEGEWELGDGTLRVAGEKLKDEEFELVKERSYSGEGTMVETENFVLIIES